MAQKKGQQSPETWMKLIQDQLIRYAQFDFKTRLPVSVAGDDLDAIIVGINTLGEELEEEFRAKAESKRRIQYILEVLLKYTMMDFSEQIPITEKGDELDAIAVGLNTLGEELQSHINKLKENDFQITQLNKNLSAHVTELEAANKELEAFSYSVSHDLRAPLRAVNGFAQMLGEDYGAHLDENGKRILDTIKENAKKMGILIDDLLTFSRLGRKELQKSEVDMNLLMEGALTAINGAMPHHAEIKVGKLDTVNADFSLIHQVMFNLLSNAIKYSSKKERPVIEIASEEKDGTVVFSVKDNGAGFNMEYANKLFGVFQRLHSEEEFEGTGVGLAIVQRIITKHRGKVWAEGKVNEGATFYFSLTK